MRRVTLAVEEPLSGRIIKAIETMRLTQVKTIERCEALVAELTRARWRAAKAPIRSRVAPVRPMPGKPRAIEPTSRAKGGVT